MLEKLADVSHVIWSHWMHYMFTQGDYVNGSWVMPPDKVKHWTRQMNTPYDDLTDKEQQSDRNHARKILAVLQSDHHVVSNAVYESLQRDSVVLEWLQSAGVDNWSGYCLPPDRADYDTDDEYDAAYDAALESSW